MKLVEQTVEKISNKEKGTQEELISVLYSNIEKAARTCYKSENNVKKQSSKEFVQTKLIATGHFGMLRHATIYLEIPKFGYSETLNFYALNHFSKIYPIRDEQGEKIDRYAVTTNYLVLFQNDKLEDLRFICNPGEYHSKRTTFKIVSQLSINREIQTHDGKSGRGRAEESTRACNYSKDRFDNELTFVYPHWITPEERKMCQNKINEESFILSHRIGHYLDACKSAEMSYNKLLLEGMRAEDARDVLPLGLKSELVYTLFDDDWRHFLTLRLAPRSHPQMQLVAKKIKDLL